MWLIGLNQTNNLVLCRWPLIGNRLIYGAMLRRLILNSLSGLQKTLQKNTIEVTRFRNGPRHIVFHRLYRKIAEEILQLHSLSLDIDLFIKPALEWCIMDGAAAVAPCLGVLLSRTQLVIHRRESIQCIPSG
jgi:hypothetical protein